LAHFHEVSGVEELAHGDLLLDRPTPRRTELAVVHPLFQIVKARCLFSFANGSSSAWASEVR
jgi:hypothetical protein